MRLPNPIVLAFVTVAARAQSVSLSPTLLKPHNVKVEQVMYKGKQAIRLSDAMKPGDEGRDDRMALFTKTSFHDGTIEGQIAGEPGPGAFEGARGFVGVAF